MVENIPEDLRLRPHWVCWRYEERDGKPTKVPYTPGGGRSKSNDPATWRAFELALEHSAQYDGVGIMLADGLAGIDLDHCRDPETGELVQWATEIVEHLDTYTEVSPSGTGVKLFLLGALPSGGRRRHWPQSDSESEIEMYSEGRYFTVTGHVVAEASSCVEERQDELVELHTRLFPAQPEREISERSRPPAEVHLDDAELLERARAAKNAAKFEELWNGGGGDDASAGDQALCNLLAFWTNGDAARMDRLFRSSGRMREKWDRRHRADGTAYGAMTIDKALAQVTEGYSAREERAHGASGERDANWASRVAELDDEPPSEGTKSGAGGNSAYPLTDLGNAERLADRHGRNVRYSYPRRIWYLWDGKRWEPNQTGHIERLAAETVRGMHGEMRLLPFGSDEAKALYKHIIKSENASRLRSMVELTQGIDGMPVLPPDLDSDPWLFCCQNGTIDLRTGRLQNHRREDMMTRKSPVVYEPEARSELWEQFLNDVTAGDEDLQAFLQVVVGYAMTGSTREEKLFFVQGPTRSGKSTFLDAVAAVLGEYATTANVAAFMDMGRLGGGHSEQLACLAGARMVCAMEPARNRKWDEEVVKSITGGDTIRARMLYQDSFEFKPQFALFVAANNRPRVRHDNAAMWQRILEIPFPVSIPQEQQDPAIKERLRCPRTEGPGILTWAVQGSVRWQEEGLQVPGLVQVATEMYRDEMDPLKDFIAEHCTLQDNAFAAWKDIWGEYKEWAEENAIRRLKQTDFRDLLRAHGCTEARDSTGTRRGWRGIRLGSHDDALPI